MGKILYNKYFRIVLNTLTTLFICLVSIYLLFVFMQRISENQSILGYRVYSISNASMSGVYEKDDVVLIRDIKADLLKQGDDVFYEERHGDSKGEIVVSRLVRFLEDESHDAIVLKGVHSKTEYTIQKNQVVGKVVKNLPILSFFNHYVKNPFNLLLIIAIPIFFIVLLEILETIADLNEEKKKDMEDKKNPLEDDEII